MGGIIAELRHQLAAISADRNEIEPLRDVARAVEKLVDEGVEAIAVCLIHSYLNPVHEQLVKKVAAQMAPRFRHRVDGARRERPPSVCARFLAPDGPLAHDAGACT